MITNIETGKTYLGGNTLRPDRCTVLGLVTFANLPATTKRRAPLWIPRKGEHQAATDVWVKYHTPTKRIKVNYLPLEIFRATKYHTLEEMIEAYK